MYGIVGRTTRQLLTYRGRVILHSDRGEMEFLFPAERIVYVPKWDGEFLPLSEHPDMAPVKWPLKRNDFR